jgi:histidine ammonia-lyase
MTPMTGDRAEPIILRQQADLTLEVLEEVAWEGRALLLSTEMLDHLGSHHAAMLAALSDGRSVYGVNTGMGYLATVPLDEDEQRAHQANLLLGRAVGGPPFLDRPEARAVLVARLAGFLSGWAGVSPHLCAFLADRLNDDFVPAIPRTEAGSAGEIIPLAHAFQTFIGVGQVLKADGEMQPAEAALMERGVAPYRPAPKEGLALLAGAPGAVALAAARHRSARILFRQSLLAAACAIDAIRAPLGPYDPMVATLANDPLLGTILAELGAFLRDSAPDRPRLQAPVSFRVIPPVLTHFARSLQRLDEDLRRDLAATTDSPAFVDGRFVTSGGFHAVGLSAAMDGLCVALIQVGELMGQHVHRLLDHRFSGLPDQLTPRPGPQAGLVVVHKRMVGAIHEMRSFAAPAAIGLADTSMGQEDAMTFAFEAAEKLSRIQVLLREVIACTLLVCRQAWALRAEEDAGLTSRVAGGLRESARRLSAAIAPVERDRPLGADIAIIAAMLREGLLP